MEIRRELKVVFLAVGPSENWLLRGSVSVCCPGTGYLARLAAFGRGARCRLWRGHAAGAAPLRDAPPNSGGRAGRDRPSRPSAALPGEIAPPPKGHLPCPRLLSQATAPHALRGNPRRRAAHRKWVGRGREQEVLCKARRKVSGMRWSEHGTGQPRSARCGSQAASMPHGAKSRAPWSRRSLNSGGEAGTRSCRWQLGPIYARRNFHHRGSDPVSLRHHSA